MTKTNQPEPVPEQTVSQLKESLKTCRKVVTDYRAALLKDPAPDEKPPKSD